MEVLAQRSSGYVLERTVSQSRHTLLTEPWGQRRVVGQGPVPPKVLVPVDAVRNLSATSSKGNRWSKLYVGSSITTPTMVAVGTAQR